MSRETVSRVLGIVLTAVIALLAVFGYDVGVIQPRLQQAAAPEFGPAGERGLYATLCYRPEGGASFDCDDGGAFKVNSGASIVFEGATANDYETTLTATDPTIVDRTISLPNASGEVMVSPGIDAAGGWFAAGQDMKYEGTTANDHEAMLRAPSDPPADYIYSLPAFGGYVALNSADNIKMAWGSSVVTGTLAVNHGLTTPAYALCAMGTDPVNDQEDRCTVAISGGTVTVKVWKEATTPTAGDSGVTVYWLVGGAP